jgi:hypothetical protein
MANGITKEIIMKITKHKMVGVEEVPDNLGAFANWEFTSSTSTGEDFAVFARKFRSYIKKNLPEGSVLVNFSTGHYELSGFIRKDDKYVYFSISDVRHFPNEWISDVLIRTARDEKDYTGGSNNSTTLKEFRENVSRLLS